jgi:hypothetical protein
MFFKIKMYSPNVRGEIIFCLKNIRTDSSKNKSKYYFYYFYQDIKFYYMYLLLHFPRNNVLSTTIDTLKYDNVTLLTRLIFGQKVFVHQTHVESKLCLYIDNIFQCKIVIYCPQEVQSMPGSSNRFRIYQQKRVCFILDQMEQRCYHSGSWNHSRGKCYYHI